ncbi:MAG: ComF family protein [Acidobacteriota bacterium]
MLAAAANVLVRALLSPVCAACRARLERPLDGPVCGACWRSIRRLTPPWCDWCGDALPAGPRLVPLCARCLQAPPSFDVARSAALYDGSVRDLIHAFKYERRRILAAPLARLLLHAGGGILSDVDAVVPVPLHPWRSLHRGFNQADDLAQHLKRPVWRVLRRTRHGPPQSTLSAAHREAAIDDAFTTRLWSSISAFHGATHQLRGATLVLVDDVMTTGATVEGCSRALLEAGARAVRVLTVARAVAAQPSPRPPPRHLSTVPRR